MGSSEYLRPGDSSSSRVRAKEGFAETFSGVWTVKSEQRHRAAQ
jgi:hypothetical protein